MKNVINAAEKSKFKKAEERKRLARYLLRTCKRNGTRISKEAVKSLFADAKWHYNENDTYLNIPDEK